MAIFAVIAQPGQNAEKLPGALTDAFPLNLSIGPGVWLVAGATTAQEVSSRIGITPDLAAGPGMVLEVASYFGRANPAYWSWIRTNWEAGAISG